MTIKSGGVEVAMLYNVEVILETENDTKWPTSPVSTLDDHDDVETISGEEIPENQPNTLLADSPHISTSKCTGKRNRKWWHFTNN